MPRDVARRLVQAGRSLRAIWVALALAPALIVASTAGATTGTPPPASRLQAAVASFAKAHPTFPGVVVSLSVNGDTWEGSAGTVRLGGGPALRPDASFRIASVTKSFVAAAMLRLVETGRVRLDAPVETYLSPSTLALLRKGGYDTHAILVRHLLRHTSGLFDYAEDPAYQQFVLSHGRHHWTRAEQLRWAVGHGKPYSAPGEEFHYSDTGYILLGEILERATGKGLAPALRSLLGFDRLGLRHTYLETLEPKPAATGARAHQYYERIDSTGFNPSFDLYGGGGLVSTVGDLRRFYDALFAGKVFRKPATLTLMRGAENVRAPSQLGMGMFSGIYAGEACWGHSGFWGTTVLHCPRSGATIAITVNQASGFDRPSQTLVSKILHIFRNN